MKCHQVRWLHLVSEGPGRLALVASAHTVFNISNAGWSAIAACGGLLLAIAAAIFGYRQFGEARRSREEQAQPYVAIYMEPSEADAQAINLVIRNFGATAAQDIHVAIEPPPKQYAGHVTDLKVPSVIHTLVPGQDWTTFWDTAIARNSDEIPRHHTATIGFKDTRGRELGPYTFDLDWNAIMDRGYLVTYNMHELARAVRDIRDLYRSRGDSGHAKVMAYDGDAHDERERERWERISEEREQERQQREKEQTDEPGRSDGDEAS